MADEGITAWLRRSGWMVVAAAAVLGMLAWRTLGSSASNQPSQTAAAVARVTSTARPKAYFVYVTGEVRRPGVYEMGGDTRVIQALRRAGGPTKRADLTSINLAAPISDGQQIVVAAKVAALPGGTAQAAGTASGHGPVSLASATAEQLEALDGIGPALAARIIAYRTEHGGFQSIDQLLDVPGIGDGRLAALRSSLVP